MKILHVSYADSKGGAAIATRRIHTALLKKGIDSKILCVNKDPSSKNSITAFSPIHKKFIGLVNRIIWNLLHRVFRVKNLHSLNLIPTGLHQKINSTDADIINLHWINGEMISIKEIAKITKPIVWTFHDLWPILGSHHYPDIDDRRYITGYPKKIQRDLDAIMWNRKVKAWQKFNPTIICVGNWLGDCVSQSFLFKNCTIKVIPNTLNLNRFLPRNKEEVRTLFGLPKDKKLLLFGAIGGTKDQRKGFDLLINALLELHKKNTDLELVVFGEETPENALDLPFKIYYLGRIQDEEILAKAYASADLMCVPSRQETFGQTAAESMACGIPVVAFNSTGLKDIVDHKKNGYLATPFDVKDLANGIDWILTQLNKNNKADYKTLCLNARDKVVRSFSEEIVAEKYTNLYTQLLLGKNENCCI